MTPRQCPFPPILAILAAFAAPGYALDVGRAHIAVDRPSEWDEWDSSHHKEHFAMGCVVGAPSFLIARYAADSRPAGYLAAGVAGLVTGYGYEIQRGWDGSAYVDSVDAGYVLVGSLASAFVCDMTGEAISLIVTPDSASVGYAVRW